MHACPECGMACDCDGEDLWHDWPFNLDCTHECEDEDDDLYLDDDAWSEEPINPLAEKLGISIKKAGVWRITPDGLERIEEQPVIRCEAIKPRWTGNPRRKWKLRRKRNQ